MTALTPIRAGLTPRQCRVYAFVRDSIEAGPAPSIREIADACDMAVSQAHAVLQAVVSRGWLTYRPNRRRSLALTQPVDEALAGCGGGLSPYRIDLPPALAVEIADFADARGLPVAEVVTEALVAHVRGIPQPRSDAP